MQRFLFPVFCLFVSCPLMAQHYSRAPLLLENEGKPASSAAAVPGAAMPHFPKNAITRVGENTLGQHSDAPASPASPAAPANPQGPASVPSPANPASPTPPTNPVSTLWPRDTIEIFLPPCTGLRPQYIVPCTCVITRLIMAMPHDEFLKKSEEGTIEQDPRLQRIRLDCTTAPQKKE